MKLESIGNVDLWLNVISIVNILHIFFVKTILEKGLIGSNLPKYHFKSL